MIIDSIGELSIKEKIMIFLCFPCVLYKYKKYGVFSNISISFLILIYSDFLIQNTLYDMFDMFDSKNIVFATFLWMNFFTYVFAEALRVNSIKAYLEVYLTLFVLLLLANFHVLSKLYTSMVLEEIHNVVLNQKFEVGLMVSSFALILLTTKKLFFASHKV